MKKLVAVFICLVLLVGLMGLVSAAGQVTDTLSVKVGYYGMATQEYVEVATYHWSELYANLPLYQAAYSFFRLSDDGSYRTVIDSAYGFHIDDLMDYAGIATGEIQSMQFYTQDQSVGYFTSFTYAELFQSQRYYFNDLSAHIHPVCDEQGNFVEYDASEAWNDCYAVAPMLALEDSWVTYEIGTEHTAPDYSSLGTGNRFRLLFGQASPMEMRTNQSAKYTHTVYVTLQGAPKLDEELPQLDTAIGSHTASFSVNVGNQTLLTALGQLLHITSSDESVLEITGVTVTPSSEFSDMATVMFTYTVHTQGNVSVCVGFGSNPLTQTPELVVPEPTEAQPTEPAPTQPTEPAPTQPTEPAPMQPPAEKPSDTTSGEEGAQRLEPSVDKKPEGQDAADIDGNRVYLLGDDLVRQLQKQSEQAKQPPASQQTTALAVREKDNRLSVLCTALGTVLLAIIGAASAASYYEKGRNRK